MSTDSLPTPQSPIIVGQPAWDVALMFPMQGGWTEDDYLSVALSENWMVEYSDGCIEVLPMPTIEHQLIVKFLLKALESFTEPRSLGVVLFAPLPLKTVPRSYREPGLIFNFTENHAKRGDKYYTGADLVMEVVSEDRRSHERDYDKKREDYAKANIPEYWIVDPQSQRVTVLALEGSQYVEHGVFLTGMNATSRLLDGFSVNVDAIFAAARQ
jgi:Uma2 family endonuclease